jgi:hypothetical protein
MAISRPFLLALLGVVLLGATVFAVQSSRTAADGDATPVSSQSEPAAPAQQAQAGASPEETLRTAFDLGKLDSAAFDAKLSFDGQGQGQSANFALSGAFETGAANDIPEFEVNALITAGGEKLDGGFVSLGDKAYFTSGKIGWRVPAAVWDPLVQNAASGNAQQAQQLPFDVNPQTWVRDVKSEGTETIDGVETAHVSAQVDPRRVVEDIAQAANQSGADVPSPAAVSDLVKTAELDAWVGADDGLLRRLSARLVIAGQGAIALDLSLTDVNQPQRIEAPDDVRPGAPGGALGALAQGVVGGIAGVSGSKAPSLAVLSSRNPQRAARAVRDNKKVVILFRNPRGLDDRAMGSVMRDVARRTNAVVLTDHVDAVERYGELVENLGVSQTPSIVIIDRSGEARLVEGYLDSDTLTQAVADTR